MQRRSCFITPLQYAAVLQQTWVAGEAARTCIFSLSKTTAKQVMLVWREDHEPSAGRVLSLRKPDAHAYRLGLFLGP